MLTYGAGSNITAYENDVGANGRKGIPMEINISGISIEVRKKKIKNMYLSVKPPEGKVTISAPLTMNRRTIEAFARSKLEWIRMQKKKYEAHPKEADRQYVSGEILYFWGEPYLLLFQGKGGKNSLEFSGGRAILTMREDSTPKQREAYIREQYRGMLKEEIARLLPKWEALTGLHCSSWHTKYMTTRWGTCNTVKKRLWFNVQLAQKPVECLEYVILHELAHTRVSNHGAEFVAVMDEYMPKWREVKRRLNA